MTKNKTEQQQATDECLSCENASITSIVLEIGQRKLELTLTQAKNLIAALMQLFPQSERIKTAPPPYPIRSPFMPSYPPPPPASPYKEPWRWPWRDRVWYCASTGVSLSINAPRGHCTA